MATIATISNGSTCEELLESDQFIQWIDEGSDFWESLPEVERFDEKERDRWQVLAEFALFVHCMGESNYKLEEAYAEIEPFADGVPLKTFLAVKNSLVTHFPIDTEKPYLARLYAFKTDTLNSSTTSRLKEGWGNVKDATIGWRTSAKNTVDGDSWTLAAALLKHGLEDESALTPEKRKDFARWWAITGACDGDRVTKVKMGKKVEIRLSEGMQWLIPSENENDAACKQLKSSASVYVATTYTDAWKAVSGEGFKPRNFPIPEIQTLHILVGGSIAHLAHVILLTHPQKSVLWVSEKTKTVAQELQEQMEKHQVCSVQQCEMSSDNLPKAFEQLRKLQDQFVSQRDYINVTGGNFLMRYAALTFAKLKRVGLLYRDVDQKEYQTVKCIVPKERTSDESGEIAFRENDTYDWEELMRRTTKDAPLEWAKVFKEDQHGND